TLLFCFSSRRRHTRFSRDWSSDVCSSDLFDYRVVSKDNLGCTHFTTLLLVLPPRELIAFLGLEDRVDVSAPRDNVSKKLPCHVVARPHVTDCCAAPLPALHFVNVVVVPELRNLLGEPHHQSTAAPKQACIQKLHVRVLPHELLKLTIRVVLQHPRVPQRRILEPGVEHTIFHLREGVAKHLHVG